MRFAQTFALGSSARRHVAEQQTVELALNELSQPGAAYTAGSSRMGRTMARWRAGSLFEASP